MQALRMASPTHFGTKAPPSGLRELGIEARHAAIAGHYDGLIDGFVVDSADEQIPDHVTIAVENTLMATLEDKVRLARTTLAFADEISTGQDVPGVRCA